VTDDGEADRLVEAVARDWRQAGLRPEDEVLCAFADDLTRKPEANTPAALDTLRAAGFDDRAIHDAVQVISYFNYITRVADGLGIEPELGIPPWGEQ
jgi:uncharacterized peroxidase-related enzyme